MTTTLFYNFNLCSGLIKSFFAAAPTLWNALPDELRALGSLKTFHPRPQGFPLKGKALGTRLKTFMTQLKTHYFKHTNYVLN